MPLKYENTGTRNKPLSSDLEEIIKSAAEKHGLEVVVVSGGQDPKGKTVGSNRHNHGHAGDIQVYKDGKLLAPKDPQAQKILQPFAKDLYSLGATSIGAGTTYMGGRSIHVDNAETHGLGVKGVRAWGDNEKAANAPDWLKQIIPNSTTQPQTQAAPSKWADTYSPVEPIKLAPYQPIETFDYSQWNPLGWKQKEIDQTNTDPQNQLIDALLSKVDPNLRGIFKQLFTASQPKAEKKKRKKQPTIEEDNTEENTPSVTPSTPIPQVKPTEQQSGWASMFKKVEDKNSKFNHGNGAYGSFGYRQSGHLADAFNSPAFSDIRNQYKDYNNFWSSFTQGGYSPLSNQVDAKYEQWLKDKSGNDINKAAAFNYAGYAGLNASDNYTPEGQISIGEYKKRMGIQENGGWLTKYKEGGTLSKTKAKKMLQDNSAHGNPLTEEQKHYFQAIAHGWKPKNKK